MMLYMSGRGGGGDGGRKRVGMMLVGSIAMLFVESIVIYICLSLFKPAWTYLTTLHIVLCRVIGPFS